MAKSLYRHPTSGKILRVPVGVPPWNPAYPNKGMLHRGIEICCPSWNHDGALGGIGNYCAYLCSCVEGEKSSVYTPKYYTVYSIAGITDCPPGTVCTNQGYTPAADLNGHAPILLTQHAGYSCAWTAVDGDWGFILSHNTGLGSTGSFWIFSNDALTCAAFQTDETILCRLPPTGAKTLTSWLDAGDCGILPIAAHSGTVVLNVGDTT